jgi:hypothetical protein
MKTKKPNRTGRSVKVERHVRLYHWMINTPAWLSLDCVARALYIEVAARYAGTGSNNGRIGFSVRDAATRLRIGKSSAQRAFAQLQHRGFLVAGQRGSFGFKIRHSTTWRLTEHPSDVDGGWATKEFARWDPQNAVLNTGQCVPTTGPTGIQDGTEVVEKRRVGT